MVGTSFFSALDIFTRQETQEVIDPQLEQKIRQLETQLENQTNQNKVLQNNINQLEVQISELITIPTIKSNSLDEYINKLEPIIEDYIKKSKGSTENTWPVFWRQVGNDLWDFGTNKNPKNSEQVKNRLKLMLERLKRTSPFNNRLNEVVIYLEKIFDFEPQKNNDLQSQKIKELETELKKTEKEYKKLFSELDETKKKLNKLQKDLEENRTGTANSTLNNLISSLKSKNEKLELELKNSLKKISELEKKIQEINKIITPQLEKLIKKLETENNEINNKLEKYKNLNLEEIEKNKKEYLNWKNEVETLREIFEDVTETRFKNVSEFAISVRKLETRLANPKINLDFTWNLINKMLVEIIELNEE